MRFEQYLDEAKEDNLIKRIKNAKDRKELDDIRDLFIGMILKKKIKKKVNTVLKTKYNEFAAKRI